MNEKTPYWFAWQTTTAKGTGGRWSKNHFTFDGEVAFCGKKKPETALRTSELGLDPNRDCPICHQKYEEHIK